MIKDTQLFITIKKFLTDYLPQIKKKSPNTIGSYKHSINQYFDFICEKYNKSIFDICTTDFTAGNLVDFMIWLKKNRKNSSSTLNVRMINVRQFCKYLMKMNLISIGDYAEMQDISMEKEEERKPVEYLTIEQMNTVLKQPDTSTKIGLRDKFFIELIYDSACRDQEILDLKMKDFQLCNDGTAILHVVGKGRKYRAVPVSKDVVNEFKNYVESYNLQIVSPDHFLFFTSRKGIITRMSDDNVARILNKYEAEIKKIIPTFPHLHPHLFRHTRAMHLYTAGTSLPLVSEWLGHASLSTTQIYAHATLEMKRKAAEKASKVIDEVFESGEFSCPDNEELLKKLYGLR